MSLTLRDFLRESNRIEGISGVPDRDLKAAQRFLEQLYITVADIMDFVSAVEPSAVLRDRPGSDVRVGPHVPPRGGPHVRQSLAFILDFAEREGPYRTHVAYETLHPFSDGNGRSGRMLWLWQHYRRDGRIPPLGFLHTWYYESLQGSRM